MRVCIICGSKDVYVDVYDSKTIVMIPGQKSLIDPPKHYCKQHFYEHVWNKPRSSQEGK